MGEQNYNNMNNNFEYNNKVINNFENNKVINNFENNKGNNNFEYNNKVINNFENNKGNNSFENNNPIPFEPPMTVQAPQLSDYTILSEPIFNNNNMNNHFQGTDDIKLFLKDVCLEMGVQGNIESKTNEWSFCLGNVSVTGLKKLIEDEKLWEKIPLPIHVKMVISNKIKPKINQSQTPQIIRMKPRHGYVGEDNSLYIMGTNLNVDYLNQFFFKDGTNLIPLKKDKNGNNDWIKLSTGVVGFPCVVKLHYKINNIEYTYTGESYEFKNKKHTPVGLTSTEIISPIQQNSHPYYSGFNKTLGEIEYYDTIYGNYLNDDV